MAETCAGGEVSEGRIISWFSCGAASAVATAIACLRFGPRVEVCYCDTSKDEHPDNARFMADVERWTGCTVKRLRHPKYATVDEAVRGESYIIGPYGAACTRVMKREIREAYQRPDDTHVFGFTADEKDRIDLFDERHPELKALWVLAQAGITKEDCYHTLTANGIELPMMYRLGYNNNNCRGCWKGGMGYWNKIRRDFPEIYAERAATQREMKVGLGSGDPDRMFFLDTLDPNAGRDVPEPPIECGIFCGHYSKLIDISVGGISGVSP